MIFVPADQDSTGQTPRADPLPADQPAGGEDNWLAYLIAIENLFLVTHCRDGCPPPDFTGHVEAHKQLGSGPV